MGESASKSKREAGNMTNGGQQPQAASQAHSGPRRPSAWMRRFAPMIAPGGAVLDLACGSGRHSRLFLELGHPVTAIDIDLGRLGALRNDPRLEAIEADLESAPWPLPSRKFWAVAGVNYLHRPLFADLVEALEPGGLLLYATFAEGNERYGRPANPDHLLRHGELLEIARTFGLFVLAYEDLVALEPRPACRQRLAARKPQA
jgi:SAM-dependent methyltransferase